MKIGVICDMGYKRSICMSNYYHAICNMFEDVKIVNNVNDLNGLDMLFIGNDHFHSHLNIWRDSNFIRQCNEKRIKVCVYTAEFIHSNLHPWNVDIQKSLEGFEFLHQRVLDVNDAIKLNKKIARCACSKYYENRIKIPDVKLDKFDYVGAMYTNRRILLEEVKKIIDIDIFQPDFQSWEEYMNVLAKYRFVLSPYSNDSNSFHLKFYECFLVDSIPIHQIYDNSLEYYPIESNYDDAIYFQSASELPDKISNCKLSRGFNKPWLEDELLNFFTDVGIVCDKYAR